MKMKHTPGPWTAVQGDGCFIVETSDPAVRFVVQGLHRVGDRANACLIAAAPKLLEQLKIARLIALTHYDGDAWPLFITTNPPEWLKTIDAAIAEATESTL